MSPNTAHQHEPVRITLPVDGMTCAACQANVQRALTATPGVAKAAVNLMTHDATVHYDPSATDPARLVAAINDTGYSSQLPDTTVPAGVADDERDQSQAREYAHLRTKSLASLALGVLAMVASMPLMSGGGHPSTALGAGGVTFVPVAGSEFEIPAELVLLAMGFVGPEQGAWLDHLGVALDERGNLRRDDTFASRVPGVFVAGDMGRGQSLIVWAIAEGRACAATVDAHLMGSTSLPSPVAPDSRYLA